MLVGLGIRICSAFRLHRCLIEGSSFISNSRFQETSLPLPPPVAFRRKSVNFNGKSSADDLCYSPLHFTKSVFVRRENRFGELVAVRNFSSSEEKKGETEGEKKLKEVLSNSFPKASRIMVEDISGGCGSMYQIFIESSEFAGLPMVKQHILVNTALKKEIKEMHGLRIQTSIPKGKNLPS